MLTEQQRAYSAGWFDEMRLAFLMAVDTRDLNVRHEQQRRFRLAVRKLNDLIKEVNDHDKISAP